MSCSADLNLPELKGEVFKFELTNPYILIGTNTGTPPVIPKMIFPVNPKGAELKSCYEISTLKYEVNIGGEVDCGIPSGLKNILLPLGGSYYSTDYFYNAVTYRLDGSSSVSTLWYDSAFSEEFLEDSISFSALYDNSKYTALTISGFDYMEPYVSVKEYNNSLHVLSQSAYYLGVNYNPSLDPMYKSVFYKKDPRCFLASGKESTNSVNIPMRRGVTYDETSTNPWQYVQNGMGPGFSFILWDGASTKNAVFKFSNDSEITWHETEVRWDTLKFNDVPLQYVAWYSITQDKNVKATPPSTSGSAPVATNNIYEDFTMGAYSVGADITDIALQLTGVTNTIDNFVLPSFYPANASTKRLYLMNSAGTSAINGKEYVYDGYVKAELADRICLTAVSTGSTVVVVGCDTFPPDGTHSYPSNPLVIKLHIKVTVS